MTTEELAGHVLTARIPGSKSLTNRILLLSAAAEGTSRIWTPLVSEDTVAFRNALTELGVTVKSGPAESYWDVTGLKGGPRGVARVWCSDAGTAGRFLPPFVATGEGDFLIDGSDQLRARPQRALFAALSGLGVDIEGAAGDTFPARLRATGAQGGDITVDSSMSSQYLSGLLMAAPLMHRGLLVRADGLVSRPYVAMTIALMRRFGARVTERGGSFEVPPGGYTAKDVVVEPDASTASYFLMAAAVTGSTVTVPGLNADSFQGDVRFAKVLEMVGARVQTDDTSVTVTGTGRLRGGFTIGMGDISDTFMTLAAVAPLADAPVTITGIGHARLKESDRIEAVAANLHALGIEVATGRDWITVHPGVPRSARIACHRDHRIAMAFSVLQQAVDATLTLDDPQCVAKTFPQFHAEMRRLFPRYETPFDAREMTKEHR